MERRVLGTYRTILALLDRREKLRFGIVLCFVLAMGFAEFVGVASILPFLAVVADPSIIASNRHLARLYEIGGFETTEGFLAALGGAVFVLILTAQSVKAVTLYVLTRFAQMRVFSLAQRLMAVYLSQPYSWHLSQHSANLGKSILSETDQVVNGAILPAMKLITYGIVSLCLIALVFLVDPTVALIAAASILSAYFVIYGVARRMLARIGTERVALNAQRYRIVQEAFGGLKDVKVLGLEQVYANRFRAPARRFAVVQAIRMIVSELPRYAMEALLVGAMLVLLLAKLATGEGGFAAMAPALGLYAFAGARLFPAMQQLYAASTQLRFYRPALMSLHAELTAHDMAAVPVQPSAATPLPLRNSLRLEQVRYTYPGAATPALHRLDLEVRARTTVGLVGGSGAGKTTAVDVILGLLPPHGGRLLVDDTQIDAGNMAAWRRSVGYVPQQIFLADDTVAANIAFGIAPEAVDMTAVERAARLAELHDFVMSLPLGYGTDVGERGVRLSGGQRQRIGIARALYRDPDVLIMDEATAALDTLTERAVMDAVHNLAHAKTIILIAHRLSTVRDCDEIFLLEDGQVAAHGTYAELLERSDRFREMAGTG